MVLFDEIEKAHPDVLNILLQILDDGHITDAQGRVVNFENTVIVMTSNAGSDSSAGPLGFGKTANELNKDKAMKALQQFLRPEFINRVDEVICFNQLSEENFRAIARIMLQELQEVLQEKNLTFTWDETVLDQLVKDSYSAAYGARNLRRHIQKSLEDPIGHQNHRELSPSHHRVKGRGGEWNHCHSRFVIPHKRPATFPVCGASVCMLTYQQRKRFPWVRQHPEESFPLYRCYRWVPRKKSARVPRPEWAPITGPTSPMVTETTCSRSWIIAAKARASSRQSPWLM